MADRKHRSTSSFGVWLLAALLATVGSPQYSESSPRVSIVLPEDLPSKGVQIHYFLIGTFGGYSGSLSSKPGVHSYEIEAAVDGTPAESIKVLVYAAGCKIQTVDLPLAESEHLAEPFNCRSVRIIELKGQVAPELIKDATAQLRVFYMAYWAHQFFGISDGPTVQLKLGQTRPERDGYFAIEIPDFTEDSHPSPFKASASLNLLLFHSDTTTRLESELPEFRTKTHELPIQSYYPFGLRFRSNP